MDSETTFRTIPLPLGTGARAISTTAPERALPEGITLVAPCQTHTVNTGVASLEATVFPDTDALVTIDPRIAIGVRTADCVPVVLNAPDIGAVAAIHAGWRGTIGRITARTVARLKEMGADPALMHAAVGPAICGRCYEVSPELERDFREAALGGCVESERHLNLPEANIIQLTECGVAAANITDCGVCTLHFALPGGIRPWPSWRRDNGTRQRLMTIVWLDSLFS